MDEFVAVLATQTGGGFSASVRRLKRNALPAGEVLISVAYSSLNYKDGLAATGKPGVIRSFPMVLGIDLAGVVEESNAPDFKRGDAVLVTGCGTSETIWGGYAQLARLNAEYIVPLPASMTLAQAMGIGTAGFTAMLAIMALESHGVLPGAGSRDVLVTGASGGVGSLAVAMLAKLGYSVTACTGRTHLGEYLRRLGAERVIDRAELAAPAQGALGSQQWGGAIDTVGGHVLANVLRATTARGSVAACGIAGSASLNTTVFPFILRGVNLLGVDSVRVPKPMRLEVWKRLERDLSLAVLDTVTRVEPMTRIFELGAELLGGQIRGRTVIDVNV